MAPRPRRHFTLIELLVVIAIIGVLSTLLLTALRSARMRTQRAVAKSQISAIKAALSNYKSDMGKYPRRSARPTGNTDTANAFRDDCHALYAALRNRPTRESGGGQNSPYLEDWKPQFIGVLVATASIEQGVMGTDEDAPMADPLSPDDIDLINTLDFQKNAQKGPGSATPLVLLDPWGHPWHFREWASVRQSIKDHLMSNPTKRTNMKANAESGNAPIPEAFDRPHSPESYDLWSGGPNGINEYGGQGSDDVSSWSSE